MQEYHGAPTTTQTLLKKTTVVDWWKHHPGYCESPGLQDIKWVELYKKWGPLIPADKKKQWYYYCNPPPQEIVDKVKTHAKASQKQRKNSTRTDEFDSREENDSSQANKSIK